jgi:hypothetical protein
MILNVHPEMKRLSLLPMVVLFSFHSILRIIIIIIIIIIILQSRQSMMNLGLVYECSPLVPILRLSSPFRCFHPDTIVKTFSTIKVLYGVRW